jgi:uncharacterized protein YdeI (YjbR/CyaY-like superfamily)
MGHIDPRIDAYIAQSADFAQPVLKHLRSIVHAACPQADEAIKWGFPHFVYGGRILASMASFKAHCAFGFWHGEQVAEAGKGHEAMGQFGRIASLKDLPAKGELAKMVKKAAALIDAGVKPARAVKAAPKPVLAPPLELAEALARNASARRTFEAFSPSQRREYIEWIVEAKRDDTRARRLAQTIEWLQEGKTRNWKYEAC